MRTAGLFIACSLAAVARAGCDMPGMEGTKAVLSGEVSVNLTPAHFAISAAADPGGSLFDAGVLDRLARRGGWRPDGRRRVVPAPAGDYVLRGYRSGDCWLMQGISGSSKFVLQAVFDATPRWAELREEAPGRDPAGVPRFAGAVRFLHLAGKGFEVACYRVAVAPRELLAEAITRLRGAGWKASPMGETGLSITRPGRPDAMLVARPEDGGTAYMIIVTEVNR